MLSQYFEAIIAVKDRKYQTIVNDIKDRNVQYFDRKVVNKFKDREDQTIGTDSKDRTYGHTDTRDHAYVYGSFT